MNDKFDPMTGGRIGKRGRRMYQQDEGEKKESKKETKKETKTGNERLTGIRKMQNKEVCPFTMKLSAMLDAGLPVLQCVEALEEQTDNPEFQKVCRGLYAGVESGESFADSLKPYEKVFGDLYIKMIHAGEQSGNLPEVCGKLAHYMEKSAAIKGKVKSAMMYPLIVMIIATGMTLCLVTFVVPIFADMFSSLGGDLPAPTKLLITLSDSLKAYWWAFGLAVYGIIKGFSAYKNSDSGGMFLDRLALNLPIFGTLVTKVVIGRLSRTFASLLQSGMPILQTVEIVGQTAGNRFISEAVGAAYNDIENGQTITEAFQRTERFPSMMIHMLRAGEKTACMEQMLEKVADFYEDEVDNALDGLSSMLEPLLMVGIGSVVGAIVIAMFLPIFKIGEAVTNA